MKFLKPILSFVLIFSFFNFSYASGQMFMEKNPFIGKAAKDFTLDTLSAKKVNMTHFRDGKSAIVFFWATWCPHCREQLSSLNANRQEIEGKGIKIILVDIGENADQVRSYVEKNQVHLEVFLDEDQTSAEDYGLIGVPTFFLINKNGMTQAVEHHLPENYEEILLKT